MKLVIDASNSIKWLLGDATHEPGLIAARRLLVSIVTGEHIMIQPAHWIAEVIGVLARRYPNEVAPGSAVLHALSVDTAIDETTYLRAALLSQRLRQHLFDTLYHAVALVHGATLVTADDRYFAAAHREGSITRLQSFALP